MTRDRLIPTIISACTILPLSGALMLAACSASQKPGREKIGSTSFLQPKLLGEALVDDPLTGGTTQGQQYGGRFTSEGFVPGKGQGHILYRLPETAKEGYAQFQAKGLQSPSGVTIKTMHGLFGMYDGRNLDEPVTYEPQFKENHYRFAVAYNIQNHWIQGALSSASTKDPERQSSEKPLFTDSKRDFWADHVGAMLEFDPKRWYTIMVKWRDQVFTLYVDGLIAWQTKAPFPYTPSEHRVWLGSAPGMEKKYQSQFDDVVFRNFRLLVYKAEKDPNSKLNRKKAATKG